MSQENIPDMVRYEPQGPAEMKFQATVSATVLSICKFPSAASSFMARHESKTVRNHDDVQLFNSCL
jgi:hypothetical protein